MQVDIMELQATLLIVIHCIFRLSHKFFMLVQMSFWFHCYPELYLMKIKQVSMYYIPQ